MWREEFATEPGAALSSLSSASFSLRQALLREKRLQAAEPVQRSSDESDSSTNAGEEGA